MDWQLAVAGPAIFPVFWGLVRTPPEKRDQAAIDAGKVKINEAMKILDAQLDQDASLSRATAFSYGDIPVGIIAHRYSPLVTDRPAMKGLERWHAALLARPPYKQHVVDIPLV